MKTGEIYTLALTNPDAKFKSAGHPLGDFVVHFNKVGKLLDKNGDLVFPRYNTDWELLLQEVTWQEAIQAWADGKTVYFELNRTKVYLQNNFYLRVLDDLRPISKDEIFKGKWFVE